MDIRDCSPMGVGTCAKEAPYPGQRRLGDRRGVPRWAIRASGGQGMIFDLPH